MREQNEVCTNCGHEWVPRVFRPKACPKCHCRRETKRTVFVGVSDGYPVGVYATISAAQAAGFDLDAEIDDYCIEMEVK